ncbi:endonuclease [Tenacibaculum holothuriorum]|uniref:Endonuclease n=1 Tax=Tenacibaculum holothuriorum TaxID=1635173 RepID=A0A1Y2PGB9_9FLAO|nr:endonuclease/exonuclease/phosphatase family protein [Tenacibaculum holothuriorum]OSY88857.1 endonuclease [Tenacibaculum holothuriorum]
MTRKFKRKNTYTIAFYNVENLFDTINNPHTADDDFTPDSRKKWDKKRYNHKLRKISSVLPKLGKNYSTHAPAIIGLVEVENKQVLKDLTQHKNLLKYNYGYIHYDSSDERGIDTALLYKKDLFIPISSDKHAIHFEDDEGIIDYTRDLLVVKGMLKNELVYVFVNHWPSRRDGEEETKHKRIASANLVHEVIENIKKETPYPNIIIMGDFNDDPSSESIKEHLMKADLFNPMENLHKKGKGTLSFRGQWNLFDQIILSRTFLEGETSLSFCEAKIFNKDWLKVHKGKLKGTPFRTYIGPWYQGGFSDHLPVFVTLGSKS